MNNKAIIEFGFCRIYRILQIKVGVIHLDPSTEFFISYSASFNNCSFFWFAFRFLVSLTNIVKICPYNSTL